MFASLKQRLRRLLRDESGPTAVEYAVMLAMIIIVALASISLVGRESESVFRDAAKALDQKTDGNQDGNGQW